MIENVFANLSLAETHGDLVRNIVSLRVSEDLFDDLSDDPAAFQSAIDLETKTKPPLFESRTPIIDRPFEESSWNAAIGYPFTNWMRSRYSDGSFGVWYGADSVETTIYETAYHWKTGFLADAGFLEPGIKIERRIYNVRCDAALIDLRPAITGYPALGDPVDYTLTQQIGARLHREGHPGLISKSARCPAGDVYAVLNPRVLRDPRQTCGLTYTITKQGIVVERTPGTVLLLIQDM